MERPGKSPALVSSFLAVGGRVMLSPAGKIETGGDLARILGDVDPRTARRGFVVARRFHRRLRDPRFARRLACLIVQQGRQCANGWLTMEAAGSA